MKVNTLYEKFFEYSEKYFEDSTKLEEKVFNISNDVNELYRLSNFDSILKSANDTYPLKSMPEDMKEGIKNGESFTSNITDTSILKDPDCVKAHAVNPVPIIMGVITLGNSYGYVSKDKAKMDKAEIKLSINHGALSYLLRNEGVTKERLRFTMKAYMYNSLWRDLSEERVKLSITHELSHWIQDSLHGRHITNLLRTAAILNDQEILKLRQKYVDMTYFEIDAQIHAIDELKKRNEDNWNTLTLRQLFTMYPSLRAIAEHIFTGHGADILNIWIQSLVKRMHREGLLGSNMKKFPKPNELFESIFSV